MEEEGEDLTPFWVQSSANRRRNRLPSSSLFLNSGVLLFALCIAAILFLFFIIPSILSLTAQIFRPNLLRKSWDSLNVVLVLFALIFGFLSRNKNYDSSFDHQSDSKITSKSIESTPRGWYEHTDRTAVAGLRRTYGSYPDLREISPSHGPDDQWRFFDDMQVDAYRYSDADQLRRRRSWKRTGVAEEEVRSDSGKTIYVDTLVTRAKEVTYTPPPEASPPPPADIDRTTNRTNESVVREERESKQVNDDLEREEYRAPPPSKPPQAVRRRPRRTSEKLSKQANNFELQNYGTPAVLSPPQSVHRKTKRTHESVARKDEASKQVNYYSESEEYQASTSELVPDLSLSPPAAAYSEKKNSKSERRSGGSATKDFLTSLYHQRKKKKKQRQKSIDNFETLLQPEPPLSLVPPPSPPPPPPPPPPSTFYSIFSSKKGKIKKIISIPPPPPPPPPSYSAARASKSTAPIVPTKTRRPPLPVKLSNFHGVEETSNSGGESPLTGCDSPLHPIPPPPPPPPPFRMPSWKFLVKGDYVKIGSMNSTRSVSPEPDEVESPTSEMSSEASETPTSVDGDEAATSAAVPFGPSLDVNTKADMFIAKFRAGLKLQKMNSMKRKQGVGFSNLGPLTKPGSGP